MKVSSWGLAAIVAVALPLAATPAFAQSQRLAGTIVSVDGHIVMLKTKSGDAKVTLSDKGTVLAVEKVKIGDIKKGEFVGVGAMPQADGSQKAIRVMIFPEMQRGTGEGHYPWTTPGSVPNSTMTNATVDTTVTSVEGQVLTVKYKGGTQKIIIGPDANIVSNVPGGPGDLKPGVNITVPAAEVAADGSLETARVNIGRDGFVP